MKRILFCLICCLSDVCIFCRADISDKNAQLLQAAIEDNLPAIKTALSEGADPNTKDENGMPILIWLASNGRIDAVKILLEKGADVNIKAADDDTTALWVASQNGHIGVVDFLLEKGADVNAKRITDGVTALWQAAWQGHIEIVKLLLEKEAEVNAKTTDDGTTALWIASQEGHTEIVKLLIEKGADVNAKAKDGNTPLSIAEAKEQTQSEPAVSILSPDEVPMAQSVQQLLKMNTIIHANSFLNTISAFETLRNNLVKQNDLISIESVDLILRELRTLRSVAIAQYIMIDRSNGRLCMPGIKTVEFIENALVTGGLLLPSSGWQPGPTLGAQLMSRDVWQQVKQQRIKTGRWIGAFQVKKELIALPGLDCFKNQQVSPDRGNLPLLSQNTDETTLAQQLQDLSEIVGILSQLLNEFDAMSIRLEDTTTLQNSPYANSIKKTRKMLADLHSMYRNFGGEISPSLGRGRFDFRNLYDPLYFRQLAKGLENYGYSDVSGVPVGLGTCFYESEFPSNSKLIEKGDKAGFFELDNNDLIVPGLRFYQEKIKTAKQ